MRRRKRNSALALMPGVALLGIQMACGGGGSTSEPANKPPQASNGVFDNGGTPFNQAKNLSLQALTQAADPEGGALTFRVNRTVSGAEIGGLTTSGAAGTFVPAVGVEGSAVFEIVAVDVKGATSNPVTLTVNLVDTKAPLAAEPLYDTTAPTNHDVTVSISSTEKEDIPAPAGWVRTGTSTHWTYTRTYTTNITGDPFTLVDKAGNPTTKTITTTNIDKTGPMVEDAAYSTAVATNQDVTATLRSPENLPAPIGWTKAFETASGKYAFTKTFTANATETVSFTDLAGNRTDKVVAISWIDKTPPAIVTFEAASSTADTLVFHVVAGEGGQGHLWFTATPPSSDPTVDEVLQHASTNMTVLTLIKDQVVDFSRTSLFADTAYTAFLVVEDALGNRSAVRRLDARTTRPVDHPSTVAAPTFSGSSSTALTVVNGIADADGVRTITYFLFSDAAGTQQVGTNTTGEFTGLAINTSYWAKTTAETLNANTGVWSLQSSPLAAGATTQAPPAAPAAIMSAASDSGKSSSDHYTNLDPVITWAPVPGATSYERSLDGGPFTDLGNVASTTVTGLADGIHTITIRSIIATSGSTPPAKASGLISGTTVIGGETTITVTIDKVAQAIPVVPSIQGTSTGAQPIWIWVAIPGATSYLVSLDGAAEIPVGTGSFKPDAPLSDGVHRITVKSVDLAGNASAASAEATVTILTTLPNPPGVTMTAASDSGASNTDHITNLDPVLTWEAVSNATSYEISTDGMVTYTNLGNVLTTTVTGLPEGTHTVYVRSRNAYGSSLGWWMVTFTLDRTALPIPAPASLGDTSASPTWTWSPVVGATGYLVSLDGGAEVAVTGTSFIPASPLAEGSHAITVKSVDLAGNRSAASPAATAQVLTTLPAVPAAAMTAASDSGVSHSDGVTNLDPVIAWAAVATATSYEVSLDGSAYADLGDVLSTTLGGLAEGTHSVAVRARNGTGPGSPALLTITLDRTAPAAPFVYNIGTSTTATPTWIWVPTGSSYLVSLDGAPELAVATPSFRPASPLADGVHSIVVRAVDLAGNISSASAPGTVTVQVLTAPATPAPQMTATSDSGSSNSDRVTNLDPVLTWLAVPTATNYEVSVDGGAYVDLTNYLTTTMTGLVDGSHTLAIRARNYAGTSSPATLIVTIDRTAPAVPAPTNLGTLTTATPTWTWAAVPGATGYWVSLDGGAETLVATPSFTPPSALSSGAHAITVKAVDLAGNLSSASAAATVTISSVVLPDVVPDDLSVSQDGTTDSGLYGNDHITSADPKYLTLFGANTSNVQMNVDSTGWVDLGLVTEKVISGLADGTHSISFRAMNGSTPSAHTSDMSVTILKTAPAKVSENFPNLNAAGATGSGTLVVSQEIPAGYGIVSATILDYWTGNPTGGSVTATANGTNTLSVSYAMPAIAGYDIKIRLEIRNAAGVQAMIDSVVYSLF